MTPKSMRFLTRTFSNSNTYKSARISSSSFTSSNCIAHLHRNPDTDFECSFDNASASPKAGKPFFDGPLAAVVRLSERR